MSSYVLIHGSWHGAWCWYKIAPRLEAAGHRVIVPDLPGHGRDPRPPGDVSMADYVETITSILDASDEPVVLVAHSRGGIAISQAAEERPEKIRRLVYLAAYLLPDGHTVVPWALGDADSRVIPNLEVNEAAGWDMLRRPAFREALYADCSEEDVALAHALLTPEPSAPSRTPLRLSPEQYGRIPRIYVELSEDRAVSWPLQKRMLEATPCKEVLRIDAGHSAYFSRPDELTGALLRAGGDGGAPLDPMWPPGPQPAGAH